MEQAFQWIARDSLQRALNWFDGLLDVIESLSRYPDRCPLARECAETGEIVRQKMHGSHRIVFRVVGKTVQVLHVVHAARQPLDPDDLID